ncbi:MAG: SRPBCC family protein [Helicobacteraceae bacterium]|nr:SRPBCC family protein [Candidatus Sulfurimonas ponti]
MMRYEKSSLIRCDIEELFSFHLDLKNLQAITPKDTKVSLVGEMFTPQEGDFLRLKTVKNFIPIDWEVLIYKVEEPNILVDLAIKSPFAFWEHSHIFTQKEDGMCELKDVIRYKAPFGFIGVLFDFFVSYELEKMFTYRHEVTKKILEG